MAKHLGSSWLKTVGLCSRFGSGWRVEFKLAGVEEAKDLGLLKTSILAWLYNLGCG